MRTALLVTALLVVTAGCIGGPTAPGTDTTTTAGPTAATATETPTPTATGEPTSTAPDREPAPGVARNGTVDAETLLDAHTEAVAESGAVVTSNYSLERGQVERRAVVEAGFDRIRGEASRSGGGRTVELAQWVNETSVLVRTTGQNRTEYRAGEPRPEQRRHSVLQRGQLADLLTAATFELGAVEEGRVTLVSTGFDDTEYEELRVEVVVTEAGVVESLSATGTQDGETFTVEYAVSTGVGAVSAPDWLAEAPPVVAPELSVEFENCSETYLRLDNDGGDPLPAGSVVEATANDTTDNVTLEARLEPGDSRYLYLTGEGLQVAGEPPTDVVDIGSRVSVRVVTDGGLLVTQGAMGFGCEGAGEGSGRGSAGSTAGDA